jgi:hypothetical protein
VPGVGELSHRQCAASSHQSLNRAELASTVAVCSPCSGCGRSRVKRPLRADVVPAAEFSEALPDLHPNLVLHDIGTGLDSW